MAPRSLGTSFYLAPENENADKGQVITIKGDSLCATITSKGPIPKIEHNCNDEKLYNFKTVAVLEKDKALFDFDPDSN